MSQVVPSPAWKVVEQAIKGWPATLRLVVLMIVGTACLVTACIAMHMIGVKVPTTWPELLGATSSSSQDSTAKP